MYSYFVNSERFESSKPEVSAVSLLIAGGDADRYRVWDVQQDRPLEIGESVRLDEGVPSYFSTFPMGYQ